MIETFRAFESYQKVIQSYEATLDKLITELGKFI